MLCSTLVPGQTNNIPRLFQSKPEVVPYLNTDLFTEGCSFEYPREGESYWIPESKHLFCTGEKHGQFWGRYPCVFSSPDSAQRIHVNCIGKAFLSNNRQKVQCLVCLCVCAERKKVGSKHLHNDAAVCLYWTHKEGSRSPESFSSYLCKTVTTPRGQRRTVLSHSLGFYTHNVKLPQRLPDPTDPGSL